MLTGREQLALMIAGWLNRWLKPKTPPREVDLDAQAEAMEAIDRGGINGPLMPPTPEDN